jgi:cytochrome c556
LLATACAPPPDNHPDKVLTKRVAIFKQFTRTLEPMALMVNERKPYDPVAFLQSAQDLAVLADKPWRYFPQDGNYPPTHALPAVWAEVGAFAQAQDKFKGATAKLLDAAKAQDIDRIRATFSEVTNSCKSCHDSFRSN